MRAAVDADVDALVALCQEHATFERVSYDATGKADGLRAALFRAPPALMAWVAADEGKLVGYATAMCDYSTWAAESFLHMDCLFVRASHRNHGIGQALLDVVTQYAREQRLREIQWQTPAWNVDARRFYERQGGVARNKLRFSMALSGYRDTGRDSAPKAKVGAFGKRATHSRRG